MTYVGLACWVSGMLVALILTPVIRSWATRKNLLDRAAQFHTTHSIAVPRLGGLALIVAFDIVIAIIVFCQSERFALPPEIWVLVGTCTLMFAMGFWDDITPLGARLKLAGQIIISFLAYYGGLRITQWVNPFTNTVHLLGIWESPVTILWIVGVTNLINLVDGVDGLAAGLCLFLMLLFSLLSGMGENYFSLFLSIGMVGALIGFLYYNFPPAKIFLGDGGAYFLGALTAELALLNSNKGEVAVALVVPFFAMGLPIIDTCFTIFRRGLVGLPIFRADRKHIHHRVGAMGFSRQRVVLLLYAVCGVFSLLAVGIVISKGRWLPVFFGLFMFTMVISARVFGFVQDWYKVGRIFSDSVVRRKHTKYALLLGQLLITEAERVGSLDELWQNFGHLVQKLKFRNVQLKSKDLQKQWKSSEESWKEQRSCVQQIKGSVILEITFSCDEDQWDEETLKLVSELAAEAWVKASAAYEKKHRMMYKTSRITVTNC